ncbi:MAG: GAF and HD-GYP domain-containing protein [Treponema sp.]
MNKEIDRLSKKEEILLRIFEIESSLHNVQDVDVLLEIILTEARKVVSADAGSIYVVEGSSLSIRYSQNDSLKNKLPKGQKLPYTFFSFPINSRTISGYVALTGSMVNEPDVYNIDEAKPYSFGKETDKTTGYRTVSNLTIPLNAPNGTLLGVLQMLNALDEDGNIREFSSDDEIYLKHFACNAGIALERGYLTRAMIMKMIRISEMRDPRETGAHANRVASYSVEIYDRYAFHKNIPDKERIKYRDSLRVASMLHDVGKVSIPDSILKKNGQLTDEEFNLMKTHTWRGAALFKPITSFVDEIAVEIALRHHENWDGSGYPGFINKDTGEAERLDHTTGRNQGLKGEEIPLAARIVSIADVYDALSSRRIYKEAWAEDDVLNEIKKSSGTKFDPELVSYFFEALPNIQAIKHLFTE